jgi:hypothetical protein
MFSAFLICGLVSLVPASGPEECFLDGFDGNCPDVSASSAR